MTSHPVDRSNYAVTIRQLQALRRESQWKDRLVTNPNLPPNLKLALYAVFQEIRGHPQNVDGEGFSQVFISRLAELAGLSPKTIGQYLKKLAEEGNDILERKAEHIRDDAGQVITRIFLKLTDRALKNPDQLTMKIPSNHGGRREPRITCPHCGQVMPLKKSTRVYCTGCAGEIEWMAEDALINLPDDDTQAGVETPEDIPDSIPPLTITIPGWLRIGTPEWEKLVKRVGLAEAGERRQAWFDRLKGANYE